MNPIRGIVKGSPYKTTDVTEQSDDDIDRQIEADNGEWQKQALKYVRERIFPDSRYKLKKFMEDEQLNKIRLDRTLFHLPKSQGSYVEARTGRVTADGSKAKENCILQEVIEMMNWKQR